MVNYGSYDSGTYDVSKYEQMEMDIDTIVVRDFYYNFAQVYITEIEAIVDSNTKYLETTKTDAPSLSDTLAIYKDTQQHKFEWTGALKDTTFKARNKDTTFKAQNKNTTFKARNKDTTWIASTKDYSHRAYL